jgi:hypothetical protein
MLIEIDGQIYNSTEIFYRPAWWDQWQEQNFKNKLISFHRKFEQLEEK